MRGVLCKHRGGDGAAAREGGQRLARHQRLASEDAVLIGERQPYDLELLLFGDRFEAPRGFFLLLGPETGALDKIQRATPSEARPNAAGGMFELSSWRGAVRQSNP